jgi:hypothetical protein
VCRGESILGLLIGLVAVFAGGFWAGDRHRGSVILGAEQMPPPEYFVSENSFSEVQNAKTALEGMSVRYITELRARTWRGQRVHGRETRAISDLERGMRELRGTSGEWVIAEELMLALRRVGRHERWLDIYLSMVYRAPTEPLGGRLALHAFEAAALCEREAELMEAWEHVAANPLEFGSKNQIAAVLRRMHALSDKDADQAEMLWVSSAPR